MNRPFLPAKLQPNACIDAGVLLACVLSGTPPSPMDHLLKCPRCSAVHGDLQDMMLSEPDLLRKLGLEAVYDTSQEARPHYVYHGKNGPVIAPYAPVSVQRLGDNEEGISDKDLPWWSRN